MDSSQVATPVVVDEVYRTTDPSTVTVEGCDTTTIVVPPPVIMNGIIRPRALYINGYDTGQQQSNQRGFQEDAEPTERWTVVRTGGANGSGYAKSKRATNGLGHFTIIPTYTVANGGLGSSGDGVLGAFEPKVTKAGMQSKWNLFGQSLSKPMNFCGCISVINFLLVTPQVLFQVLPDLTIQPVRWSFPENILIPIGNPSIVPVPANNWWTFEWQLAISRNGNTKSGFVIGQLYTPDTGVRGTQIIGEIETRTDNNTGVDTIMGYIYGTECLHGAGNGLDDIGVDDIVLYGDYGTQKRLLLENWVDALVPKGVGDSAQSLYQYDSRMTLSGVVVGGVYKWGDVDRSKNLAGSTTSGLDLDAHLNNGENIIEGFTIGTRSVFTGNWLDGGPFVYPGDTLIRNDYIDDTTDYFTLTPPRADALFIKGIQVYSLSAFRLVIGHVVSEFDFGLVGQYFSIGDDINHIIQFLFKIDGQEIKGPRTFSNFAGTRWDTISGYYTNPFSLFLDSDLNNLTPAKLASMQLGVTEDYDVLSDAIAGGRDIQCYTAFSVAQLGVEYLYMKEDPTIVELPPITPIAKIVVDQFGTDLNNRILVIRDASVSWDGQIVSRKIDWGDLTVPEDTQESVPLEPGDSAIWPTKSHTYTRPGTYTVKLTVFSQNGLSSVDTMQITIDNHAPIANFTFAGTDKTVNFTDASVDADGTIVSRLWNFGDGTTSTLQNPTHTYTVNGTYTVTLSVKDDLGAVSILFSGPVTVPIVDIVQDLSDNAINNVAGVQADNFHGDNPRFPSYVNTAAFALYAWDQTPYRALYNFLNARNNDGTEFIIDTSKKYNNHNTLRMQNRADFSKLGGFNTEYIRDTTNLGDDTDFAPDVVKQWLRLVVSVDDDFVFPTTTGFGDGFILLDSSNSVIDMYLTCKSGHLWLDTSSVEVLGGGFVDESHDLGVVPSYIRGVTNWLEAIIYAETDRINNKFNTYLWFGQNLLNSGNSPTYVKLKDAWNIGSTQIGFREADVCTYGSSGGDGFFNIGLIEVHNGFDLASNPFGLSLS